MASVTSSPTARVVQSHYRAKLNRKDSTHSLSSEPNKNEPSFRRGTQYGMSVNSLNRFESRLWIEINGWL